MNICAISECNEYSILQEDYLEVVELGEIDDEKTAKIILDDFRSGRLGRITIERIN